MDRIFCELENRTEQNRQQHGRSNEHQRHAELLFRFLLKRDVRDQTLSLFDMIKVAGKNIIVDYRAELIAKG